MKAYIQRSNERSKHGSNDVGSQSKIQAVPVLNLLRHMHSYHLLLKFTKSIEKNKSSNQETL